MPTVLAIEYNDTGRREVRFDWKRPENTRCVIKDVSEKEFHQLTVDTLDDVYDKINKILSYKD